MKQNTARDWLANFVIGLVVNRAPCQLLDNLAAPSWGNMKCAKTNHIRESRELRSRYLGVITAVLGIDSGCLILTQNFEKVVQNFQTQYPSGKYVCHFQFLTAILEI